MNLLPLRIFCLSCAFIGIFGLTSQAFALTISPVKVEVSGDPGQTLTGEIELFNEQMDTKTLFSSFENFEPSGDTGSPKFTSGDTGLATWMSITPQVVLKSSETKKVPYSITIPPDAEPGGYFSAIFWSEYNPAVTDESVVSIGGKLGVLILLRVNGDIKEAAGISSFGIEDEAWWYSQLPINFVYRFNNQGGDRVVPLGDIVIRNTFGGLTATLPANATEGSVLPNSIRKFQSQWGVTPPATEEQTFLLTVNKQFSDFHFGRYTANVSVLYGQENQVASDSFTFYIIPWQLLLVSLIPILAFVLFLKLYARWIIAMSVKADK
jgi:hypothetical protein